MKHLLIVPTLLICLYTTAQIDIGFVGGMNFHATGDLTSAISDIGDFRETAQRKSGYFIGLYSELNILTFYVRPEIHYTQLQSAYDNFDIATTNLELPISIGYKFLPALSVFAGPSFQYRLKDKLDENFQDIRAKSTVGGHLGARIAMGVIALDLRYERGLNESEVQFLNNKGINGRFDSRGEKWILGVSFSFK